MKKLSLAVVLTMALATPARADLASGIAALQEAQYEAAWAELKPLADGGDAEAQFHVARMVENGWTGAAASFPNAILWYRKAGDQGHADAALRLAEIYLEGAGTPRSRRDAYDWYLKAAKSGKVPAMTVVGRWNLEGIAKRPNFLTAKSWLNKAASLGDAEAQGIIDDLASKNHPILEVPGTADPTEEDARRVLSEIRNLIDPMLDAQAGATRLKLGQAATVVPSGEGHLVTLPLVEWSAGADTWRLGTVQVIFTPAGEDYAVELRLPGQSRLVAADGHERGVLRLDSRKITGTWSTALHTLTDYTAELRGLRYEVREGQAGVTTVEAMTARRSYAPLADGRYDILEQGEISGLLSESGEGAGKQVVRMASGTVSARYEGVDPQALSQVAAQFGMDWRSGAFIGGSGRPEMPQTVPALLGDMNLSARLTDVVVEDGEGRKIGGLAAGEVSLHGRDLDKSLSGLTIRYSHDGMAGDTAVGAAALPHTGRVTLTLANVPAGEMVAAGLRMLRRQGAALAGLPSRKGRGGGAIPVSLPVAMLMPDLTLLTDPLTTAKTELRIEEVAFAGQGYTLAASGVLRPGKDHLGGSLTVRLGGIDTLLGAEAGTPVVGEAPGEAAPAAMLRKARTVGAVEKDATGAALQVFKIDFLDDGKITINGKDTETLFAAEE